jgi:hypothetical protein
MKRWKNNKNIGKHFISDIAEAGAENNKMIFILNSILTQGTNPVVFYIHICTKRLSALLKK